MALKTCMNILCGTTSSSSFEWKTGWTLRSGELANLCNKCGSTFEQNIFCEEFHADDSGWRECVTCDKRLHCGCIASCSFIELLDGGGVKCIGCARNSYAKCSPNDGKCDGSGPSTLAENNAIIKQCGNNKGINGSHQPPSILQDDDVNTARGLPKKEELLLPLGEVRSTCISNLAQPSMGLFQKARLDMSRINTQVNNNYETIAHPNLNITLGVPTGNHLPSISRMVIDERDQRKTSSAFHQGFASSHHLLPRPPKLALSPATETNVSVVQAMRVARPPVEGRGRHQLLPRYWPRITDQELQQISGDSNCTIVPLFEKVLSASDAGRIGRLVLPKACAEAYFPPISQPEGLPIKIQDVKGKEWVFQFRFWPNNNSRMYVLEGVTPCIQSMQLQAGDTVTFSRIDPEGKLVMGFRKASNSIPMQPMKGGIDTHMNVLSRQLDSTGGNVRLHSGEKYGEGTEEGVLPTSMLMTERRKSRNIGSKTKRLLIDSRDVMALRLTWEEVQCLLRPPQSANPSVVVIEDFEFEEYEEPPVFGKTSIFTARSSGVVEQWAQCDSCSKWRRLPADILLPPRWTCSENAWDQSRCFCSAPDELGPKELENFRQQSKDSKKRRMAMASRMIQQQEKESCGLEALANAVTLGENTCADTGFSSVATTTKHPRHRPGCSCIVCIQPPSGKGKHKSTCTCTVCMTVKRRFKTLMMRKKKRQSEQEAEITLKNLQKHQTTHKHKQVGPTQTDDVASRLVEPTQPDDVAPNENGQQVGPTHTDYVASILEAGLQLVGPNQPYDVASNESGKGLDLNCHPDRVEDLRGSGTAAQPSLRGLLQLISLPLEAAYMKHNGLTSVVPEQNVTGETENHPVTVSCTETGTSTQTGTGTETENGKLPEI